MDQLMWCKNHARNPNNQQQLERAIKILLKGKLASRDERAQEKCIKTFSEYIRNSESNLLRQRNIHPHDLKPSGMARFDTTDNQKKYLEVEKIISVEINRQLRHFNLFL